MSDVIQLLPENIANQIAAGEVVQRPASVVKELLENAIDAGATEIKLAIKDAGKTLVQVIDNGCGMSETDARMCFERHATSKIRDARDLFAIRTMGFRGEALASIAAVAQVEMRTKRKASELGTRILVENSEFKLQEPSSCDNGTSIAVKNLFYNVPARRNFLKSDTVEMRHILDEFYRVAMANADLFFSLHIDDVETLHLQPGNLRQRIVKVLGENVNKKLVPVEEGTDVVHISGFVGKPDHHKKTRGEQYFFVNRRFIKSSYLHHAVLSAYDNLLPTDTFPLYVLFLDIDPGRIDINVHPTKQEIKFDDEKLIYNILKVAVRHALGAHNLTPTLDFEQEPAFQLRPERTDFPSENAPKSVSTHPGRKTPDTPRKKLDDWQKLYENLDLVSKADPLDAGPESADPGLIASPGFAEVPSEQTGAPGKAEKAPYQLHNQYVINHIKSGFLLIDQQAASERILYERYLNALQNQPITTQPALFPKTITLAPADALMLKNILDEVNKLGFEIAEFGGNAFIVHGVPVGLESAADEQALLERVLAQYREDLELQLGIHHNLARSMARNAAIKKGQSLSIREMQDLIDQLFACETPYQSPFGKNCFITFELEELQKRFKN